MNRYIEAEEVEKRIDIVLGSEPKAWDKKALKELKMYVVHAVPTADVRKNIKAKKVLAGGILDGTTHWYECSCCHGAVDILDAYCKHCGAVLELEIDRCKEFLKLTEGKDGKQE